MLKVLFKYLTKCFSFTFILLFNPQTKQKNSGSRYLHFILRETEHLRGWIDKLNLPTWWVENPRDKIEFSNSKSINFLSGLFHNFFSVLKLPIPPLLHQTASSFTGKKKKKKETVLASAAHTQKLEHDTQICEALKKERQSKKNIPNSPYRLFVFAFLPITMRNLYSFLSPTPGLVH